MTRTALEGFGKTLLASDEVVVEATGNSMAVSRVLAPFVAQVIIANPLQLKAIAQAHVKTDKIDAGTLASLQAAGYLPQIWTPDAETERKRRLVARRHQVVPLRTRLKNEVHSILHAHLIPKCPHADLFNGRGRTWLAAQPLPDDERAAIDRHVRELDRLTEDLGPARPRDRAGRHRRFRAQQIDDDHRRQLGGRWAPPITAASARSAAVTRAPCWSRRPGQRPRRPVRCMRFSCASEPGAAKAHRALLAFVDEGRGLPVGAPGTGRYQDPRPYHLHPDGKLIDSEEWHCDGWSTKHRGDGIVVWQAGRHRSLFSNGLDNNRW